MEATVEPKTYKPRPDWRAIRKDFMEGRGTLAELSRLHSVPLRTIERRCANERWRESGGMVAQTALAVAKREGERIGMSAAALALKTLEDVPKWLQRVEVLAAKKKVSPKDLRALVASWKDVIGMGRLTLGMDSLASANAWSGGDRVIDVPSSPAKQPPSAPERPDDTQ